MLKNGSPIYPSQAQAIIADDSEDIVDTMKVGMRWFIGIPDNNIHTFEELDHADRYIRHNRGLPSIVILDNNTPKSNWKGASLAFHLLENRREYPNLIVVTVSSSDMGLLTRDEGRYIEDLKKAGGEFWAKHTERFLMTLWLADCMKEGKIISRETWLSSLGISTRYQDTIEDRGPEESKLFLLFNKVLDAERWGGKPEEILASNGLKRGDFFKRDSGEVLSILGFPRGGRGPEWKK